MKKRIRSAFLCNLLSIVLISIFAGCGSTRTVDGVTIEKKSGNPLKFW